MSNMLKCPNPSCPYVFDPSQVPVGVVLSCPRCAMQFTLGPPAPTAPPPTTAPTAPAPSAATDPDFEAVGRTADADREQRRSGRSATKAMPAGDAPRHRDRDLNAPPPSARPTNKLQIFILAGIAAVLMAGTGLALIFKFMRRGDSVPAETVSRLQELNVGVDTPPTGWTRDDSMRVKVGSPYVLSYKRENPEAYMAFGAFDPRSGRSPRPSEMRTNLMAAFPKLFDMSTLREEAPVETQWLSETIGPTHGFNFRAQSSDGLIWAGEAYTVAHKGLAYFWLSWCGETDYEAVKPEFKAFRGKFKILEMRKDWKETQSNVIDYKGDKVPYTFSDAEEVWKETGITDFKPTDPDLDKRLRINQTPKRDRKAIPDEAELRVYILDGAGDPVQVARQYVEKKETDRIAEANSEFAPPTFEELTDAAQGDPIQASVHATTPVVRLRSNVKESANSARLIVASGLKVGDKVVVLHCWCEYRKRDTFETKFVQIASSLR